jgi:hypothetical protein
VLSDAERDYAGFREEENRTGGSKVDDLQPELPP